MGLGLLYQKAGLHQEAVDTFKRAIHINRINEGLYNFSEIPILEQIIESHAALGEWQEVNDRYNFLFQVHNRHYGRTDPRVLPALKTVELASPGVQRRFQWKSANHLLTARNLFDSTVRIIAVNFGNTDPRLAEPLRKRTMVDYYLATHIPQGSSGTEVMANVASFSSVDGGSAMTSYMVNSYAVGKRALGVIRDIYGEAEGASLADRVATVVELGDWHMLFDRRQSAFKTYAEALAMIEEQGGGEEIHQKFFGKPVALPATQIFDGAGLVNKKTDGEEKEGFVLVKFIVDEDGRTRHLELVEAQPPDRDTLGTKLRKRIRAARFRPRFEGGQPVKTPDVYYRYLYSYTTKE